MSTPADASPQPTGHPVRVTLLTRPQCHLCEFAREAVSRVVARAGVTWAEVSVESDPELEREYGGRVPVVLVDGREHDYFRVDEQRLSQALTGARTG